MLDIKLMSDREATMKLVRVLIVGILADRRIKKSEILRSKSILREMLEPRMKNGDEVDVAVAIFERELEIYSTNNTKFDFMRKGIVDEIVKNREKNFATVLIAVFKSDGGIQPEEQLIVRRLASILTDEELSAIN